MNAITLPGLLAEANMPLAMTTVEIGNLTGKDHKHVMRDTKVMFAELKIDESNFGLIYKDVAGRNQPMLSLTKDLTLTLVSGYNVVMRKRIIDRWLELEARPAVDPMQVLNDPTAMRGLLLGYTERVIKLQEVIAVVQPKANALDRIATATEGSFCIRDAAKNLQIQEKKLRQILIEQKWAYVRPMGTGLLARAERLQQGLMEHKIAQGEKGDGSEWASTQARITAKGMAKLALILGVTDQGNLWDQRA